MIIKNELDGVIEQPSQPLTIGQRLRLAREQHHYTQRQVAQQLRLKCATVQYIEEALPPEALFDTFMRGYIRSYARLVHLADHDILPALSEQSTESILASTRQRLSLRHRQQHTENRLMHVTWLMVVILLGLTVGWWWQHHRVTQEELTLLTRRLAAQRVSSQPPCSKPVVTAPMAVPMTLVSPTAENALRRIMAVTSSSTANSDSTQVPFVATETKPSQPLLGNPAAVPTNERSKRSCATLSLHFNGECWLVISDASGKTLFKGSKKMGDQLHFQGQPPYQLTLGAPRYVTITYQQQPVNLSGYISQNRVARFTLMPE